MRRCLLFTVELHHDFSGRSKNELLIGIRQATPFALQLSQPEILELIAMSALAVYATILADATAMEADAMFHSFWDSKK